MNIIKLQGGLGNQLFQYVFALYLKKKLNTHVKFDLAADLVAQYSAGKLELQNLGINPEIASVEEIRSFKKLPINLWRVERKICHLLPSFNKKNYVQNNAQAEVPLADNIYYDGYFQKYFFVDEVINQLRNQISTDEKLLAKNSSFLAEVEKTSATAIHIRRGDYIAVKANRKIFEICDMDYYTKAIDYIKSKTDTKKFFIFTQDKDWAKENFIGDQFEIFEGKSAIEDLLMMSKCYHNIIGNSTFSWWAATLNPNADKIVVAPKKWYKDERDLTDFIGKEWIRI